MSDGRFSQLERDRTEEEEEEAQPAAPRRVERAIELEGELEVDESGPALTHFCRACEAENRPHMTACFNCGAALGWQGQEAFDKLKRRELAAEREHRSRDRSRADVVDGAREALRRLREQEQQARQRVRAAAGPGHATLRDPRIALLVLSTCLFATVSATLHLFLSAAYAQVPWSVLAEVAIAIVATWIVFTGLRKRA